MAGYGPLPILFGTEIGACTVREHLARGPAGTTYAALDTGSGRPVTVTVLDRVRDPEAQARFAAFAPSLVALRHPHLVPVLAFGEHDGVPFVVWDVPAGTTLAELPAASWSHDRVVALLWPVAGALDHLHGAGVVHGDLRPATIVVGDDLRPAVTGYGLVPLVPPEARTLPATGAAGYQAPELALGGGPSAAADVFAFAAVARELLAGTPAAPGAPRTGAAPPGPATAAVLGRGLAPDPAARWPGCGQLMAALADALRRDDAPAARPPGRRRGWLYLVAALAALVLVALLGVLSSRAGNSSGVAPTPLPSSPAAPASVQPAALPAPSSTPRPRPSLPSRRPATPPIAPTPATSPAAPQAPASPAPGP